MDSRDVIVVDSDIMTGKPVIKGTRITVELVLRKLAEGASEGALLEAYPDLKQSDIRAVLSYSADVISKEEMIAR
jgi:uncharacterized protein (DUF433 family)